jgi:hypothetical protein
MNTATPETSPTKKRAHFPGALRKLSVAAIFSMAAGACIPALHPNLVYSNETIERFSVPIASLALLISSIAMRSWTRQSAVMSRASLWGPVVVFALGSALNPRPICAIYQRYLSSNSDTRDISGSKVVVTRGHYGLTTPPFIEVKLLRRLPLGFDYVFSRLWTPGVDYQLTDSSSGRFLKLVLGNHGHQDRDGDVILIDLQKMTIELVKAR